jgi:hypothetical protein
MEIQVECPYPNCNAVPEKKLKSHLASHHLGYYRQVCHTCEFKSYNAREMFEHGKTSKHKIGINAVGPSS